MLVLWFVVVMAVLYTDFGVQPLSILTTTTVFAAVLGFALQETLGNIFSGLSLSMGRPFEPGDWIRSGQHLGRVKGIAWRATTIVTRANERLEIPNSVIAKDVLFNYATGHVRDELKVGISYGVPPNHVREVVLTLLRDVPQVLREPPPEVLAWNYADFAIQYQIKILDCGLRGAGTRARSRRVEPLVCAPAPFDRDSVPDPHRPSARRGPRAKKSEADADFERELMADLRQVDWLRGLSDDELRLLVPTVSVRQFGAGEMLVRAGEQGESMFIVRSGKAEVFGQAADGQIRHIANIGRGDVTGEMALMTGEPRNASVRAITRPGSDRDGSRGIHPPVQGASRRRRRHRRYYCRAKPRPAGEALIGRRDRTARADRIDGCWPRCASCSTSERALGDRGQGDLKLAQVSRRNDRLHFARVLFDRTVAGAPARRIFRIQPHHGAARCARYLADQVGARGQPVVAAVAHYHDDRAARQQSGSARPKLAEHAAEIRARVQVKRAASLPDGPARSPPPPDGPRRRNC